MAPSTPRRRPRTVATWDAGGGVDAIEFFPSQPDSAPTAAVATYSLGADGVRSGSVAALRLDAGAGKLVEDARTPPGLPAVLDVRVTSIGGESIVVAACADGTLRGLRRDAGGVGGMVELWKWAVGGEGEVLLTAVDVCVEGEVATAVVPDSRGCLHVVRFSAKGCESVARVEEAHVESAWAGLFGGDEWPGGIIYSGGDDAALAGWDMRAGGASAFRLRKAHDGVGVTSLLVPRGRGRANLLTGGYDDFLRLWDVRSMRRCVSEIGCGGGVWRIKEGYRVGGESGSLLLAGCMYDGFKAVVLGKDDTLEVVSAYRAHGSLAYGTAWVPGGDSAGNCWGGIEANDILGEKREKESWIEDREDCRGRMALTGSFYDDAVHLWAL